MKGLKHTRPPAGPIQKPCRCSQYNGQYKCTEHWSNCEEIKGMNEHLHLCFWNLHLLKGILADHQNNIMNLSIIIYITETEMNEYSHLLLQLLLN